MFAIAWSGASLSTVIVRLDRTIQYYRDVSDGIDKPRRTGYPACAGYDGGAWEALLVVIASSAKPLRPALRTSAFHHRLEHPPHLGLGLLDARLQRGKVRRVAGARHHAQQAFARRLRLEADSDAKPQDLRQVVVEPSRRTQDLRI